VYLAPIPRWHLPLIGPPAIRLEHAAGAAWRTADPMPLLEQNIGAGIQLLIFHGMLFVDPAARPLRFRAALGAQLPVALTLPIF
jgi:hypothetical protein